MTEEELLLLLLLSIFVTIDSVHTVRRDMVVMIQKDPIKWQLMNIATPVAIGEANDLIMS